MATLTKGEVAAYAARGVSMRLASRTDVGLVRPNNEDFLVFGDLASGRPALGSGRIGRAGVLFGVCDGMGGAAAGEVASRMAARVILQQLARSEVNAEPGAFRDALSLAVVQAGEAIRQHVAKHPSCRGMGTTCTVAAVRGGLLLVAQVGDSRAYLVRAGELRQLTTDQTWANEMLARGRVSPEQAAVMENGKTITQAVGTNESLEIELVSLALCEGDRILICSDGLSGMVADADLASVLIQASDLELASDELLRLAHAGGGRDNISFVLCEFTGKTLSKPLGASVEEEPEYRLPMKRGPRRAAAVVLALLVVGAMLWRANRGSEREQASPVVHAAQSPSPRGPKVVVPAGGSGVAISPATVAADSPAPEAPHEAPKAVRPRMADPGAQRPARSEPRENRAPVKIERPREEEIHIIREDDPVAGSPF